MTVTTEVNADGQSLKVVGVASNGEQIGAAAIGLLTAGPIGALASWGSIRMFAGKWTPWTLTGFIAAPVLNLVQFAMVSAMLSTVPAPSTPSAPTSSPSTSATTTVAAPVIANIAERGERVTEGMSKSQVASIMGSEGKKSSSTLVMGSRMEMYTWGSIIGSRGYVTVMYMDGVVSSVTVM